jgi:predicted nuclease of predicted toxin-antitoxin system
MKILANERVFAPMIAALRADGHHVVTAKDSRLLGARDEEVYRVAVRGQYFLLTMDKDFTKIHRFNPRACAGIIVGKLFKMPVMEATEVLIKTIRELGEEGARSNLVVITREGARIRRPT